MSSINEYRVRDRVASVFDTFHGAQVTVKGIKDYVKNLEKSVGISNERAGSAKDFLKDVGSI